MSCARPLGLVVLEQFDSEPRAGRNRRYHTGFCVKQSSLEDCQEGITVGERSIVEGADGEELRVY
jgi:hypothetical protein